MQTQYLFDNKWLDYGIFCCLIVAGYYAYCYRRLILRKILEYMNK